MSKTNGKPRSGHTYRELTDDEQIKVYGAHFTLEELIRPRGGDTYLEAMSKLITTARWRVTGVFNGERKLYRGKYRKTDCYIRLISDELDDLANYVLLKMRRPITDMYDLADKWQDISPQDKEKVRKIADAQLVLAALIEMYELDIWYDHGHLIWQMRRSAADTPRLANKKTQETLRGVKGFYDKRNHHGHPKNHRKRHDLPPVSSIGMSRQIH